MALFGESRDATSFYADPDDQKAFLAALRRDSIVNEYRLRLPDAQGRPFWAAISGRITDWDGEEVLVTFTRDLTGQLSMEAELVRQRDV